MIKKEAKFGIRFRHWLMANPIRVKAWFEHKDTRGAKSFRMAEWKQDQRDMAHAMKYSKKGVLVRTEGVTGLPDYKYAYQEPTFVVINYPEGFVLIEAETLALEETKSLSWKKAVEIAWTVVE